MNWFDIVLVLTILSGTYIGLRTGLVLAAFSCLGLIIGVLLAGQFSDDLGNKLTGSISSGTIVTVISYTVIIISSFLIARSAGIIVRKIVSSLFLGFTDRLAGTILGATAGIVVAGALITGMARLTYNFELPNTSLEALSGNEFVKETSAEYLPEILNTKQFLETSLTSSSITPIFIATTDLLPNSAFGFLPSEFGLALDILEQKLEIINTPSII
ncbi:CvpA family protein [SAR202 cluster bacterium AD-802-E10_MRT_200m]|nr:CvpA family protein [SAR202 cluster bacterium AD-802-E10_MRT_200m]